jgi:predicted transposase YdaD
MTKFEEDRTVKHLSTAERIGRADGLREGKAEGKAEGRQEGALEEARTLLLEIGRKRLGEPQPWTMERVAAMDSKAALESLCLRVLEVESWDDLLR